MEIQRSRQGSIRVYRLTECRTDRRRQGIKRGALREASRVGVDYMQMLSITITIT